MPFNALDYNTTTFTVVPELPAECTSEPDGSCKGGHAFMSSILPSYLDTAPQETAWLLNLQDNEM